MTKKHGYCQYPNCNLDLGLVHVATKYCPSHKILQRKLDTQTRHREVYKSKFHREKVIGQVFKNPKRLPKGLKEGGPCPGNGNGYCGAILRRERAMDTGGYTTHFFDFVCGRNTHRFPDPREGEMNICEPIEGREYEILESGSYFCKSCEKKYPGRYWPNKIQVPKKKYGTNQLMSLWAWYNFKRHLLKCWNF